MTNYIGKIMLTIMKKVTGKVKTELLLVEDNIHLQSTPSDNMQFEQNMLTSKC